MTPLVLALILVGAVAHAAWNLVVKASGAPSGLRFTWMQALVGLLLLGPFALWQLSGSSVEWWRPLLTGALSAVLHTGYFLLLRQGYRAGDVGVVYPLARGTGPMLSVVLAVLLLGEAPGPLALLGAATVVLGVLLVGSAGGRAGARSARSGIIWGLATGVAIASYTIWDAYAVTTLAVPAAAHMAAIGLGQVLALSPWMLRDRQALRTEARAHWRAVLAVGVLSPLSYVVILLAIQLSPSTQAVSLIAPGREVSVVLVALAGWLIFREPHPAQRLLGSAVVIGGIVLLALS